MALTGSAQAWGPHSEITQAALDVLGTNAPLARQLGAAAAELTNYCWMGDYFGVVMEDRGELFYADDYLLFAEAPRYFDHTGPEIRGAFAPFLRRALQALRTETPVNAARWVGALTHFVQDAGCPPHAAGLRGDAHTKMEGWVETNRIRLGDYQPQGMGASDTELLGGLMRRLGEAMTEAQEKGRRLRVAVEIGNRSAVRPAVLDSALASARLTADLLWSLGTVARTNPAGTAGLRGTIGSRPPAGLERFPAKVALAGTPYATLADLAGRYAFHGLPAGSYTVVAYRPGQGTGQAKVTLEPGEAKVCGLSLPATPSNLVPNGDFQLSTMRPGTPDYWYPTKSGWDGEPVLLKPGGQYRLAVQFKGGTRPEVMVRWLRTFDRALPRFRIEPRFKTQLLTPSHPEVVFSVTPECGVLHLTVAGRGRPEAVCDRVSLTLVGE